MLSQEAMTHASHEYWLTMAEFWLKLAQHVLGDAAHRSAEAASPKSQEIGKSK
jgi:hypothetical protein